MGNICSEAKEKDKSGAFEPIDDSDLLDDNGRKLPRHGDVLSKNSDGKLDYGGVDMMYNSYNDDANGNSTQQQEKEKEEARLQLIVSTAGRDMVSIQSTRGATFYHDQGFAAALAQHLQQTLPTTIDRPNLPPYVPPSSSSNTISTNNKLLSILTSPLPVDDGGLWAMEIVNEATIAKEQLFVKCPQIVENLL